MRDKKVTDNKNPPIGGANLECYFSCKTLSRKSFSALVNICFSKGFELVGQEALLAYGNDPIEPVLISSPAELDGFIEKLQCEKILRCIANFSGVLVDVKTPMNLLADFKNLVVSISVPEDVLWKFSGDPALADFRILRVFAACCDEVASTISPIFGYIGTETLHPKEMQLDRAVSEGALPVDESFFSDARLRELFEWYLTVYVERWKT